MKKLLAFILVFTLVLGLGTVASATKPKYGAGDQSKIVINKNYNKNGDVTTTPGETFAFTIAKDGVTDSLYTLANMPSFSPSSFNIEIAEGATTGSKEITLPDYDKVGIFTYKISETAGNTAGVNYDTELFLTVYVTTGTDGKLVRKVTKLYTLELDEQTEDPIMKKVENFTNEFSAGNLAISKTVKGNMGEVDREFDVTVTFTAPTGKTVKAPVTYKGGKYGSDIGVTFDSTGKATINLQLKHGHTVTFKNLPYDVTYEVNETIDSDLGYEDPVITYSDQAKKIDSAKDTVTITNEKNVEVATGINLDSLPYLIILAVAIAGLAIFIVRRRMAVNE